ncbi:pentatricopeptide repeat-containing protein At2g20710, mitochondrial [Jatropha curcas]|uniref:pentatricopeptide repeat-containing protein At2g20710, mitochondrial n=1 Tax=Jatropha curcas TaxID=180498 RepID=UPI0005FC3383|nr:pentatricopeptide repeat-containing protein At2g20710, mitochondrial [Jatropha curcas]
MRKKRAEKVFEEWESQNLVHDIRVANALIGAYSRKCLVESAETLVDKVLSKGWKPDAYTWYYLATMYLQNDQTPKAVEMMKKAIVVSGPKWKPSSDSLTSCLEYLNGEGEFEKVEKFIKLLVDNGIIPDRYSGEIVESYVR